MQLTMKNKTSNDLVAPVIGAEKNIVEWKGDAMIAVPHDKKVCE